MSLASNLPPINHYWSLLLLLWTYQKERVVENGQDLLNHYPTLVGISILAYGLWWMSFEKEKTKFWNKQHFVEIKQWYPCCLNIEKKFLGVLSYNMNVQVFYS